MIPALILLTLLTAIFIVILVRALRFTPLNEMCVDEISAEVNEEKAVENFRDMIRCKTVYNEGDYSEFKKFRSLLSERYPNITANCKRQRFDKTAVLYHWCGKNPENPTVLMAHYDVVPVQQPQWSCDAFSAELIDGYIFGRGTLDTKATLCSIMEAADKLISEGFIPENDVYIAFSGDEEIAGNGQPTVVEYLKQQGIKPALVLDEGGAVVSGIFPGVKKKTALIGISEKGQVNIKMTVKSNGGHASSPPVKTPITELAKAVTAIQKHPFYIKLNKANLSMFDTLGRHSSFAFKIIFANLWLFAPLLDLFGRSVGGSLNALLRTSCAFTVMSGSEANNVIPAKASITANLRIMNGETIQTVMQHLKKVVNNNNVEFEVITGNGPCIISDIDSQGWNKVCRAVKSCWPEAIVSPYLMYAASDSRHYAEITDKIYRFSVVEMTKQQLESIHGNDEKISIEQLCLMIKFYTNLIKTC